MIRKTIGDAERNLRMRAIAHARAIDGSGHLEDTQRLLDEACLYFAEMSPDDASNVRANETQRDLRKCIRCHLPVSAGSCDTLPHVFHDRPEQCIAALITRLGDVYAVLPMLTEAAEHLLRDHDCDGHGHEVTKGAAERARVLLRQLES